MGTTENRGRFEVKQPKVGPKGAASGAMQVKDCREAAPKEEQVGFRLGERYSSERKTCESNERLPARRAIQLGEERTSNGWGEVDKIMDDKIIGIKMMGTTNHTNHTN